MATTRWLDEHEQRTWRRFVRMQSELSAHLGRDLQRVAQLSLPDYEVLVHLSDALDARLRPFELAGLLQWEQSRLSHHVARMQRRGLVAREDCDTDRRGAFVVLSAAGRLRLEQAAPTHAETVRRVVFDRLDAVAVDALGQIAATVLAGIEVDHQQS